MTKHDLLFRTCHLTSKNIVFLVHVSMAIFFNSIGDFLQEQLIGQSDHLVYSMAHVRNYLEGPDTPQQFE